MIPTYSRIQILQRIMQNAIPFYDMCVVLYVNNLSGDLSDKILANFSIPQGSTWVNDKFPDISSTNLWAQMTAQGLNSANEGEGDTGLITFEALSVGAPFHVYGYCVCYSDTPGGGLQNLYGCEKFTDPVAINATGDKVKFYLNVYSNNFLPTGHL